MDPVIGLLFHFGWLVKWVIEFAFGMGPPLRFFRSANGNGSVVKHCGVDFVFEGRRKLPDP